MPVRRAAAGKAWLPGLLLLALTAPSPARPQSPPITEEKLTLAEAVRIALADNPDLSAARREQAVAQAGVEVARQRPNPDLSLEADRDTPHQSAVLSVPFETAGKRRRRIELAEAEAGSGAAGLERAAMEVRNRVRRAFGSLAAAQSETAQRADDLALAERVRDAARSRFEAGDAPRLETLQAELAVAQATGEAERASGALAAARAELNTLLARPPDRPLRVAADLDGGSAPDLPAMPALVALALASSSELAARDRAVAEQEARLALARAERFPDPSIEGGVTHAAPPDFTWGWRAGLSVTLPVFNRHRAEALVEERTLDQRKAEIDAARQRIEGEVAKAAALAATARRQVQRYREEILPRTEEVERMAEDSYRSGQTGLVALLQALQAAREAHLNSIQAGLDYQTALADLEQAVGAPLP